MNKDYSWIKEGATAYTLNISGNPVQVEIVCETEDGKFLINQRYKNSPFFKNCGRFEKERLYKTKQECLNSKLNEKSNK